MCWKCQADITAFKRYEVCEKAAGQTNKTVYISVSFEDTVCLYGLVATRKPIKISAIDVGGGMSPLWDQIFSPLTISEI